MAKKKKTKKRITKKKVIKKKITKKRRAKKITKKSNKKILKNKNLVKKQKKPIKRVSKKKITKKFIKEVSKQKIPQKPIGKIPIKSAKKISKKPLKRVKSGIHIFDKMISGGFGSESINLIVGGSGSGKSIFALQFLIEGIKKGEKVLYVTFEEKKDEFYKNMKKFGWDLEKFEKSGKFIFLEYSPEKVKMMLDEGGGSIESIVLKEQVTRLVIDSITSFSLLFDDRLSKRQANLGLFDIIRKWNTTSLLTVQDDPSDQKSETLSSIEFEVDSVTFLYYLNIKGKRQRFIEVLKMRGTNHSKEIREFKISKGIKVGRRVNLKGLVK
ncbi:MAG: RAD55 family ATPase [Candidatus Nanoarchaeia archaeon]